MILSTKFKTIGLSIAIGLFASTAFAEYPRGDRHWHGDIHYFRGHDYARWQQGRWYRGPHDGRLGWWWIAADSWYLYPAPVYPYPDPYMPPVVVQQQMQPPAPAMSSVPPPSQSWYYCESSQTYYPYVANCPEGWKAVPAQPSGPVQ